MNNHQFSTSSEEFFLASSERETMRRISEILRRQGYVAVADLDGKTQFFLDPDANPYQAIRTMEIVRKQRRYSKSTYSDTLDSRKRRRIMSNILESFGFNATLSGTELIHTSVLLLCDDYRLIKPISKGLYTVLADQYSMSTKQVERNIRYAIAQSELSESNSVALSRLLNEYKLSSERENLADLKLIEESEALPQV